MGSKRSREDAGLPADTRPTKMARSDEAAMEKALMEHGTVSAVTTDQRALIDKQLARYKVDKGEFFCIRELVQNSDDAGATCFHIELSTRSGCVKRTRDGQLSAIDVVNVRVRNDGRPFTEKDWDRIATIAQGNDDVNSVGMFGVGFYSVFSLTNSPTLVSNGRCMKIFYQGSQLNTRSVSDKSYGKDTRILLPMKEPADVGLADLASYMRDCIYFAKTLASVSVSLDGEEIFTLNRVLEPVPGPSSTPMDMVEDNDCATAFPQEEMTAVLQTAVVHSLTVSTSSKLLGDSSVAGMLVSGLVSVDATPAFSRGCRQLLHKELCTETTVHIFSSPAITEVGKFYVGAPTGEATGTPMHVAGHFYPTMERVSLDLSNPYLSIWNRTLTKIAGYLGKLAYRCRLLSDAAEQDELARIFCFARAPPGEDVPSSILASAFFDDSWLPLPVVTSAGVTSASAAYLPAAGVADFLDTSQLACVDLAHHGEHFAAFCKVLITHDLLSDLGCERLCSLLTQSPLSEAQLSKCLSWWTTASTSAEWKKKAARSAFLRSVSFTSDQIVSSAPAIRLREARYYSTEALAGLPLQPSCLPYDVCKNFSVSLLERTSFLGLKPMTLSVWLSRCIIPPADPRSLAPSLEHQGQGFGHQVLESPKWAPLVLAALSRNQGQLAALPKKKAALLWVLLRDTKCMPVIGPAGPALCFPNEATVPSEHAAGNGLLIVAMRVTSDVIDLDDFGAEERDEEMEEVEEMEEAEPCVTLAFLKELRVNLHPPLSALLGSLDASSGNSSRCMMDILEHVWKTLADRTPQQLEELTRTPFLVCSVHGSAVDVIKSPDSCYLPDEDCHPGSTDLLQGQLGLPIVRWDAAAHPKLTRFLRTDLKVASTPSFRDLAGIILSQPGQPTVELCFSLMVEGFSARSFAACRGLELPFVPCTDGSSSLPAQCFLTSNPFGPTVSHWVVELARKAKFDLTDMGILAHPPPPAVVAALEEASCNLTSDVEKAVAVFEYLAGRVDEFKAKQLKQLGGVAFVPLPGAKGFRAPKDILLPGEEGENAPWEDLLPSVDLGCALAHSFLSACGAATHPSPRDLATLLLDDDRRCAYFYSDAFSSSKYLSMLDFVSRSFARFPKALRADMARSPFLLAVVHLDGAESCVLKSASDCYLVDSEAWQQQVRACQVPEGASDVLQEMYSALGCKNLTAVVKSEIKPSGSISDSARATTLQDTIRRRAPLILHKQRGGKLSNLKSDAASLLDDIIVQEVDDIVVTLRFGSLVKTVPSELELATCAKQTSRGQARLFLKRDAQMCYADVGEAIAELVSSKGQAEHAGHVSVVLEQSLNRLDGKGWSMVSKIRQQEKKLIEVVLPEAQRSAPSQPTRRVVKRTPVVDHDKYLEKIAKKSHRRYKCAVNAFANTEVHAKGVDSYDGLCTAQAEMCGTGYRTSVGKFHLFVVQGKSAADVMNHQEAREAFASFGVLLHRIASSMPTLDPDCIHIYYDTETELLAFNSSGSLFFSLSSYMRQVRSGQGERELMSAWLVTFCHELAHNVESDHNKSHEAAMEHILTGLLPRLYLGASGVYDGADLPLEADRCTIG